MNTVSWMIYWAGALGALNKTLVLTAFVGLFIVMGATAGRFAAESDNTNDKGLLLFTKWYPRIVAIWIFSIVGAIFVPSSETVYAMAASEVGEEIVNSETAGKAVQALNAWLDRQIAPEKGE